MRLERLPPAAPSDVSLIPMINVVFLLLVFFLIAGTVRAPEPLEATPPESSRTAAAPRAERTLHLAADGTLALDDRPVSLETLGDALSGTPSGTRTGGRAEPGPDGGSDRIALRADARTSFATLRATVRALRATGVREVELITVRVPARTP